MKELRLEDLPPLGSTQITLRADDGQARLIANTKEL